MKKIFLSTRNNKVPIVVGNGIISSKLLSKYIKSKNVFVITNETVGKIYTGLSRARGDLTVIAYPKAINQIKELL